MTPKRCSLLGSLSIAVLAACGGGGSTDAAVADAGTDSGNAAVNIPWLGDGAPPAAPPMLTPCPSGYRVVAVGDVEHCAPYPETGPVACGAGEAHFVGESGCRPVGEACPPGDFAESLPSSGPVFVFADAALGGDGSRGAPYRSLSEVRWTTLAPGTVIALGKGSYEGTLPLRAGVSVVGACAAETIVTGIRAPAPFVISVTSSGDPATVRNLTIADTPQSGAVVRAGRTLHLEGVVFERVSGLGAIVSDEGSTLVLDEVVIRDVRPAEIGPGRGLAAQGAGRIEGTKVFIEGAPEVGVAVYTDGAEAVLTDLTVRSTASGSANAEAVHVAGGARIALTRAFISEGLGAGVSCEDEGTEATLDDLVVEAQGNFGISVSDGCQATGSRLLLRDNQLAGALITDPGSTVTLTDVIVRGTRSGSRDGLAGRGLAIQGGAQVSIARLLVEDSRHIGVYVSGTGTHATLEDAIVRGTRGQERDGAAGWGIGAQAGASVEATRLIILDNRDIGVSALSEATTVRLVDALIGDMLPHQADGAGGHGLHAQGGGTIEGSRVVARDTASFGVSCVEGTVSLSDVVVERVRSASCAETTCPDRTFGYGAVSVSGALSLTGFAVREAALCGVMLARINPSAAAPGVDLLNGSVTDSAIGACIQEDGYDLDRLTNDIRYENNGTNLEATALPVPMPVDPVGG